MCNLTGLLPSISGDWGPPPGKVSDSITIESPILIRAFMIFPSGMASRANSFALNAFLYQSMAAAAPLIVRYGVTVWNPGGIGAFLDFVGFLAFAFFDLDFGIVGACDAVD